MSAQKIIGIIIIIIGLYLAGDSVGEYGAKDNRSELFLGSLFFMVGIWFCIKFLPNINFSN